MALEDASLCTTCQGAFDLPEDPVEEYRRITYDPQGIADAAAKGCRLCICHQHTLTMEYGSMENLELEAGLDVRVQNPHFLPGVLRVYPKNKSYNLSHYVHMERNDPNESLAVPNTLTARHTKDQRCLAQVSKWLQHCLESHKWCRKARMAHTYATFPARLLEIGQNIVRLVSKEDLHDVESAHYITLSHRWQANMTPKLLQENLSAMQEEIDQESLSQTFQDAIFLAWELNVNYLWIDALCIIQDDLTDVHREIALMGETYQGALLNIGGLLDQGTTKESAVGLFTERDPRQYTPFIVNLRRLNTDLQLRTCGSVAFAEIEKAPLMSRGWVLQERLLSPRSIYFGQQMHWECAERSACEAFPQKKAEPFFGTPRFGHSGALRITTLLSESLPFQIGSHRSLDVYQSWMQVVQWFSNCKLSFEEDCFPALLGLQRQFGAVLQDNCLAGLWRRDMINELAWFVRHDVPGSAPQIYPKRYRAPSWSWASVVAPVGFLFYWDLDRPSLTEKTLANVEFVNTQQDGAFSSGKISNGELHITGYMVQSRGRLGEQKVPILGDFISGYQVYDSNYTVDDGRPFAADSFHFILHHYDTTHTRDVSEEAESIRVVIGLMVEPVAQRLQTYRRIGMFRHVLGSTSKLSEYHEFDDWNPSSCERHTITII